MTAAELISAAEVLERLAARFVAWFEPSAVAFAIQDAMFARVCALQLKAHAAVLRGYARAPQSLGAIRTWVFGLCFLMNRWYSRSGGLHELIAVEASVVAGAVARAAGLAPWSLQKLGDDPATHGRRLWTVEFYQRQMMTRFRVFGRWRTTGPGLFDRASPGANHPQLDVICTQEVCEQCGSLSPPAAFNAVRGISVCPGCDRDHAALESSGHNPWCPRVLELGEWRERHVSCGATLPRVGLREGQALGLVDENGAPTERGRERCLHAAEIRGLLEPGTREPSISGARLLALACDDERAATDARERAFWLVHPDGAIGAHEAEAAKAARASVAHLAPELLARDVRPSAGDTIEGRLDKLGWAGWHTAQAGGAREAPQCLTVTEEIPWYAGFDLGRPS